MRLFLCCALLLLMSSPAWAQDDEGSGEEPYVGEPVETEMAGTPGAGWLSEWQHWLESFGPACWRPLEGADSTALGCGRDDREGTKRTP